MILLIHLEHQIKLFGTLFNRFIINRTPVQAKQFALSADTKFTIWISGLRERNPLFQFEIICGWIPKRLDRSLRVSCSLIASMATYALKEALCFFPACVHTSKINHFIKFTQWSEFAGVLYHPIFAYALCQLVGSKRFYYFGNVSGGVKFLH